MAAAGSGPQAATRSLAAPGLVLGMGLGGFLDGIVLHQILQWHHMLSSTDRYPKTTLAGLEANTLADGLFHAAAWLLVALGLALLWQARHRVDGGASRNQLIGFMFAGWGLFNVVEGTVDHLVLGIHHVRPGANELVYDLAFLGFGAVLFAAGLAFARRSRAAAA